MVKKTIYTKITPLPTNIPRQLALDLLHNHAEVIELNPLVTGVKKIDAPRDAQSDEYFSSWYEISEIITWGLGIKKKIAFKGVFHDQPYGLQSHVYAPMGVDLRNKYRIGGNQPGEPPEARELGVDTPREGLYLREDHEITCNIALASFVKKEMKDATGKMFDRMIRKAELLDEGKLHAMFEDGMLKTSKPSQYDESQLQTGSPRLSSPPGSPGITNSSPSMSEASFAGNAQLDSKGYGKYHDVARSSSTHRGSVYSQHWQNPNQPQLHQQPGYGRPAGYPAGQQQAPMQFISELPADSSYNAPTTGATFRAELAGDYNYTPPSQQQPQAYNPSNRASVQYPTSPTPPQNSSSQQQQQYNPYQAPSQPNLTIFPPDPSAVPNFSRNLSSPTTSTGYAPYGTTQLPRQGQQSATPQPPSAPHQTPAQLAQPQQSSSSPTPDQAARQFSNLSISSSQQQGAENMTPAPLITQASSTGGSAQQVPRSLLPSQVQMQAQQQTGQHAVNPYALTPRQGSEGGGAGQGGGAGGAGDAYAGRRMSGQGGQGGQSGYQGRTAGQAMCPVCHEFEGDEASVSHHVSRAHFS